MAPAVDSPRDEGGNNIDLELASSSGNGSEAAAEIADHGWKEVRNLKKERQKEKRMQRELDEKHKEELGHDVPGKSKAFEALEKEHEASMARRKNKQHKKPTANGISHHRNYHHSSEDDEDEHTDEDHAKDNANGEVTRKKNKKPKKPKVSISDAASTIDPVDLSNYLANLSESLSSAPDIQLVRCVDYFEKVFSSVSTANLSWDKISKEPLQKSIQMPLSEVPENVCKVVSNWLLHKPVDALSQFVLWALNDVLLDAPVQQKGKKPTAPTTSNKTKVAVFVVLAILVRRRSDSALAVAQKLQGSAYQAPGPMKLYALAWMYGQVAQGDFLAGMSLWVQNLLPLAVGTTSTPISRDIALQFIESIILGGDAKKTRSALLAGASRKERLVPPSALNALLHMAYPPDNQRTKATERFLAIYPTVKEVALGGSTRSKALKSVAVQLLPLTLAAAAEDTPGLSNEACSLFRWCLFQSPECYKHWEKLHLERLKGSTRVLGFLREEWRDTFSLLSPLNDLKTTIAALRVQNRKVMDGKEAVAATADEHCKAIQRRTSRFPSCVKASATIACTVAAAYGFYLLNPNVKWAGNLLLSKSF